MVNILLPLIFAEGKPSSLDKMTKEQMEKFIPFLLSCCPSVSSIEPPAWWPRTLSFQFPLRPAGTPQEWESLLKQIIVRCYEHYHCAHLLRFCRRLAELPEHMLIFKEQSPGFTSIINSSNKKLIVTYKKKNETYDRPISSPFKSLLPKKHKQPPVQQIIEDIYLCNDCDCEFFSCREITEHEKFCRGKSDDDRVEALDQVSALKYLGLQPSDTPSENVMRRCTSLKLTAKSYMQVPFSSPLGLKMTANICPLDNNDKMVCLNRLENFCKKHKENESQKKYRRSGGYPLRFSSKKKTMIWSHTYCFNQAQRAEKKITLRTGLNKRARLMQKQCKDAIVLVERLALLDPLALHAAASLNYPFLFPGDTSEQVVEDPPQAPPTIDLTCDDDESSSNNEYSNSSSDSFFLITSSNHKIPSVKDWTCLFPLKPLVQV